MPFVDYLVVSYEVGGEKPGPAIFEEVLNHCDMVRKMSRKSRKGRRKSYVIDCGFIGLGACHPIDTSGKATA